MNRVSWQLWLDSIRPRWLVAAFVCLLVLPACFYFLASKYSPTNGLVPPDAQVRFSDAMYFSVVTQATLGYGDYRPIGWSRFVACLQVLLGLILAGIIVSKITSAPMVRYRRHARIACGNWIDVVHTDTQTLMGLIHIYENEGNLEIDGSNYDQSGEPQGSWHSVLVSDRWPILVFEYTNQDSEMSYFTRGFASVTFVVSRDGKTSNTFQTKPIDAVRGSVKLHQGTRITDSDILDRLERGSDERLAAIQSLIQHHLVPKLNSSQMNGRHEIGRHTMTAAQDGSKHGELS